MPIEFACEECGSVLRVPDGSSGKRSRCPTCKHEQEIPWVVAGGQEVVASEKLSIPCPKCQHHLVCSPDLLGTRGQCKKCRHIFTISTEPQAAESSAPALVFHCPKCQQLFEGREEMRGRKGKCHVCQSVFMIELKPAPPVRSVDTQTNSEGPAVQNQHASLPASRNKPPKPAAAVAPSIEKPAYEQPVAAANLAASPSISEEDEMIVMEDEPAPKLRSTPTPTRTPTPKPTPKPKAPATPIRFECSQCRGVMEVPGSTAGLDTECPYCKTIQTIPATSTVAHQAVPNYTAPVPDYSGSIYGNQPAMAPSAYDPLGGVDLGVSNPYAAPTQAWSAPAAPSYGGGRSMEVTVGNVLQLGFNSLWPTCLMFPIHVLISMVAMILMYVAVAGISYMLQGLGEAAFYLRMVLMLLLFLGVGLMSAWIAGCTSRMALDAVRKKPFNFVDALNPGGAINAAIMVVGGGLLIMLVMYAPAFLHMSTGALKGFEALMIGWIVLFIPVMLIYSFGTSLALFAGADGDSSIDSLQTSMSLIFRHFGTALGVLIVSGLISGALAFVTFGLGYVIPLYMTAALYHLAKKNS